MKKIIASSFFSFTVIFIAITPAFAAITVYDDVTVSGYAVRLKALTTRALIFPDGGRLVKFNIEGKHIGATLSGGDGYAFFKYLPESKGLKKIRVESGSDSVEGSLLVAGRKEKIILIEVDKFMLESFVASRPDNKAAETLKNLSEKHLVVYLYKTAGTSQTRKWLSEKGFPASVVLEWEGEDMIKEFKKRGLYLYAVIGSPDLLSEAAAIKKRFSFEDTEDGKTVGDWDDLYKQLAADK